MAAATLWSGVVVVGLCAAVCPARGGPRIEAVYGALPLSFERNVGQTAPEVDFLARGPGSAVLLTARGAVVRLPGAAVRIDLLGAHGRGRPRGLAALAAPSHYFKGIQTLSAPSFARVEYPQVYPGVDLAYYGKQRELEFDFRLAPGADPSRIRLSFEGAQEVLLEADGRLRLRTGSGDLWLGRPRVYQKRGGEEREIAATLIQRGRNEAGFRLGAYDPQLPVVIDPVLSYSTYLGGAASDSITGIAVDSAGSAYVAGWTVSVDFPTTAQAVQSGKGGSTDAFVAKLSPAGDSLVYSTYLGGSGDDRAFGIAVDASGAAIVTGWTYSTDFPTVAAAQSVSGGWRDAFVAKLSPTGAALVFSTYLGGSGSDSGNGVAVDAQGGIYVAGETDSTDFPALNGFASSNGGLSDAFVAKYTSAGVPVYATYLGGNGQDRATAIAVDSAGQAYVTGATESSNFPTLSAFQAHSGGLQDAFVAKLNASGNGLVYSTYLGGAGGSVLFPESGLGIAVDSAGDAYVTGVTSSADFPEQNPLQACMATDHMDAFVTKLNAWGNGLLYSTCLGGSDDAYGTAIAVDSAGDATVAGYTDSGDFPVSNPVQASNAGLYNAFVATLTPAGNALSFGTYLGGPGSDSAQAVALDGEGNIYVAGQTLSTGFPTVRAIQTQNGGSYGGFVAKLRTQACSFQVTPAGPIAIPAAGASGSLGVATDGDCQWTASSNSSWIAVTSGASGSGNGTVAYSVAANPNPTPQSGTLTVAGQTFTVTQAGTNPPGCVFYLDGLTGGFPDAGGLGRVRVTLNQTPCSWQVFSDSAWITITSATTFAASGAVLYTVSANSSGVTRTGHLTVAGQTFTVTQVAGCSFMLGTTSLVAPWQGEQLMLQLTASSPSCPWTSYPDENWTEQYPQTGTGSASIQYTVYTSANTGARFAHLYIGGQTLAATQNLNPAAENERFVDLMYFGFLGRQPTAAELSAQLAALAGGLSWTGLAVNLFNSAEFNNGGRFAAGVYVGILGRDADYSGWLFQRSALIDGAISQTQLVANFLNSLEYQMKYGTPTDNAYVLLLYQNVLRRAPSSTELAAQLALLSSGTSRTQLAINFLTSAEFQQNSGPTLTAFLQYACILLRDAEQWERDYWSNLMTGGMTVSQVFFDFVNSAEMEIWLQ
ncbi:MAG: SBBP repeat-containing protein [Bryobacteraceae bacterium]